jgi:hypothetical protein
MPGLQSVSFTSPYAAEESDIERRRRMAELLQQQGQQGLGPTESVGGWAIPKSPWEAVGKAAQQASGAYQQNRLNEREKALQERYSNDYRTMVAQGLRQLQGTPAQPGGDYEDSMGIGRINPGQPAQAADPAAALATFAGHPQGAALMPLAMQAIQRQNLIEALRGQQAAPGAPQTAAGPQMQAQPRQASQGPQSGVGGPAGGVPMAAWIQADPSGKTYMEQLAKDFAEAGKPVVNRGFGIGKMVNGQYVPDAASLEQALAMERGKQGITAPMETPITLKTSSGQEIQLSRPEWAEYQKSGQLPQRFNQQGPQPITRAPLPANVPEADREAYEAVASGKVPTAYGRSGSVTPVPQKQEGIGVPGMTQSQPDTIAQEAELTYAKDRAKGYVKMAEDMRHAWTNAQSQKQMLDRLQNLFADPNVAKGALAETSSDLKNIAASLGINIKGLPAEQAIQSVVNEFALQLRNPAGGAGMPGAMSDQDRKFLASIPPGLTKTPEGRAQIMQTMRKKLDREQEIADMAIKYEHEHGKIDVGFEKQMRKFANDNPIFAPKPDKVNVSNETKEFLRARGISIE